MGANGHTHPDSLTVPDDVLRTLVHDLPDVVLAVDPDGVIVHANPAAEPVLGWAPDELVGRSIHELVPIALRDEHRSSHLDYTRRPAPRPMGAGIDLEALRRDGEHVAVEIALVPIDPEGSTVAVIHDVTARRRLGQLQEVRTEFMGLVASGTRRAELAQSFAELVAAMDLVDAVWVRLGDAGRCLDVVGRVDPADSDLLTASPLPAVHQVEPDRPATVVDLADRPEQAAALAGAGYGSAVAVPLLDGGGQLRGDLVLARRSPRPGLLPVDEDLAVSLASMLAAALDLVDARHSRRLYALTLERERIARDLHDSVIQRLFGEGLRLEATAELATGVVAERLRTAAGHLDEIIRDIRTTIFELNTPPATADGTRQAVLDVIREVEEAGDLRVRVRFDGPVDTAVPRDLGEQAADVVREGLTNVVRHADVSSADVELVVEDQWLAVRVLDRGVGPGPAGPGGADDTGTGRRGSGAGGLGLVNLERRARALGGWFDVGAGPEGGTELRWSVPLPD